MTFASFAYFPASEPIVEPHWFYFSSIGFFLIVAKAILELKEKINFRLWAVFLFCLLMGSFVLLRENNTRWKNQETYCRYWLSLNQKNMTPFYGLGKSLLGKGDYKQAIIYFERGLQSVNYVNAFILADLGYAEFLLGEEERAKQYYAAALRADPYYSVVYHYLGQFYLQKERYELAEAAYLKAIHLYAKDKRYYKYLSAIHEKKAAGRVIR